jgi:hypothetical protein
MQANTEGQVQHIHAWYDQSFDRLQLPVNTSNTPFETLRWAFTVSQMRRMNVKAPASSVDEHVAGMLPILELVNHDPASPEAKLDWDLQVRRAVCIQLGNASQHCAQSMLR